MFKRPQITESAILEININNEYYVYAQILTKGLGYAFFDFKSNEKLFNFSILNNCKIIFIVMVFNDVVNRGKWLKVGKLKIREDLINQPMKYIQDAMNPEYFELYNPNNGEIRKATKEECFGLEQAAVWESDAIEERIRDHYSGLPYMG